MTLFDYKIDFVTEELILAFGKIDGLSFQIKKLPAKPFLGFQAQTDPTHEGFYHIAYKSDNNHNSHIGVIPVDITCGSQLIFVYIDIIEYQHVVDSRAPVLKIIESERLLKKGILKTVNPVHHKSYTNLYFEKLLSNDIQSIKIELRTDWETHSFYWC